MKKSDRWAAISDDGSLREQLKGKGRRRRQQLIQQPESAPARNDRLPHLELVYLAPSAVAQPLRAVRKKDLVHVREIAASISALGFCAPILIGRDNEVIDGHARLEAARLLGLEQVPCIQIAHLNQNEQRVLRLAVNRLGEKGEWDLGELKIELQELIVDSAPIEISGFGLDEIDQIIIGDEAGSIEEGQLEPTAHAEAIARLGDLFELGPHRLLCGDATKLQAYETLMNGDSPSQLLLTDEPYNVPIAGHVSRGNHREFAMASGELSDGEFLAFNEAWMGSALPFLCDGAIFGTFIDWRGQVAVHSAAAKLGLKPLNLIVWTKSNAGMGSLYRSQHELLPLFKKGAGSHVNNIDLGKRGRWRSNVWTYPGASSMGSEARRGLRHHPTVKPTAMLEDAILDLSNRGEIVMDPFLGSGSTLIAAEKTGRVCRAIELDPLYVDVAVRRYEAVTGKSATLAETGESFAALSTRRATEAA
jgi:DNA modification methylase